MPATIWKDHSSHHIPDFPAVIQLKGIGDVDQDMFWRLQETAGGRICLVTLAPELNGAISFIEHLVSQGIIVAIGHTSAGPEKIREAVEGVPCFLHIWGMAPEQNFPRTTIQ
ncbi:MAG: hypothetical protein Ct9H300mP28_01830 [Pseudomonadota bacterium]|nr:MAG: hypothetical protein Ct9H300mP28_01830 [Pseudomonadota bacterium]